MIRRVAVTLVMAAACGTATVAHAASKEHGLSREPAGYTRLVNDHDRASRSLFMTTGGYTLVLGDNATSGAKLYEEPTAKAIPFSWPDGCGPGYEAIKPEPDAGRLAVTCQSPDGQNATAVYRLPNGPWTVVPDPPGCAEYNYDVTNPGQSCVPSAMGRTAMSYLINAKEEPLYFDVLKTGTGAFMEAPSAAAREVTTLNAPTLRSPECTALALNINQDEIADRGFVISAGDAGLLLGRCRSQTSTIIDHSSVNQPYLSYYAIGFRPHLLVWEYTGDGYTGNLRAITAMTLPQRHRFMLPAPATMSGTAASIAVTPQHIYVQGTDAHGNLGLWRTNWPRLR